MRKLTWYLTVCAVFLALAGGAAAQDDEPLDRKVNTTLRDVINRGADMYNAGDAAGCYRFFEGALLAVKPLLEHRPDVQRTIERGMADAARNTDMRRRAWALRTVLDDVRSQVGGKGAVAKGGPKEGAPAGKKKALWDRLGGEAGVTKVVDDFTALAAGDEKVNFTRDGKYKPTEEDIVALKKSLVALISATTGGPLKYTGKSMKEVHKGMGITNAEFDALARDLVTALTKNGVAPENMDELLKIIDSTRPDIVEAKADAPDDDPKPKIKPKGKPKDDMPDDEKPKEKPKEKDKDDEKPKEKDKDEKKDDEKKKDEKKDDQ